MKKISSAKDFIPLLNKEHSEYDDSFSKEVSSTLFLMIQKAESDGEDSVDIPLAFFDFVFSNHGIEVIRDSRANPSDRSYYGDIAFIYSNTGETYKETLGYDTETEEFYLTSWGDWFEEFEKTH